MNPGTQINATFVKVEAEGGSFYYRGVIDVAALKKIKSAQVEAVLAPNQFMPQAVIEMNRKNGGGSADLTLFVAGRPEAAAGRKKT